MLHVNKPVHLHVPAQDDWPQIILRSEVKFSYLPSHLCKMVVNPFWNNSLMCFFFSFFFFYNNRHDLTEKRNFHERKITAIHVPMCYIRTMHVLNFWLCKLLYFCLQQSVHACYCRKDPANSPPSLVTLTANAGENISVVNKLGHVKTNSRDTQRENTIKFAGVLATRVCKFGLNFPSCGR